MALQAAFKAVTARRFGVALAAVALAATVLTGWLAWSMGAPALQRAEQLSAVVLDRNGALLRAYTTEDGIWRLPVRIDEIDPVYFKLLFAFEDRRFREHRGIDPRAIVRVFTELARRGHLISGSSTLTMQTARLLDDAHDKTLATKVRQMIRALQLEARLAKDDILSIYLKLAPFGGNIEGVRAASYLYLGKEPRHLSIAEAALLVALPQSPNARRPDRHAPAARKARDRVLDRAAVVGVISAADAAAAKLSPVPTERRAMPQFAAHLSDRMIETAPARVQHQTTIDLRLQSRLEALVKDYAAGLGPGLSAAVLAVDNRSGEMLAYVGSPGYLDASRQGAVDMVRAVRSPGSTLKPLIYALAFDAGIAHPETLIEDRPQRFGAYVPKNFDHDFQGTVTLREALAKSLNIPAVKLLDRLGAARLSASMTALGLNPQLPRDAEPSLAMALGGVGLTLSDLATMYVALARGGDGVTLSYAHERGAAAGSRRAVSEIAAWYIADILKNAPAPANAKSGQIAYKTGTSYGFRDAWSVGYDGRHTIAVWVGRPDGASVPQLNGRAAAAPLLFDAFHRLAEIRTPLPPMPRGALKVAGGELPMPMRRFADNRDELFADVRSGPRERPLAIAYPPDRSEIDAVSDDGEPLIVKAEGGALPLTWLVDGKPIASDAATRDAALAGLGRGFVKLSVIDARGRTDRVTVRVK